MHANFCKKAMLVKQIVDEHYQPQSHKGCMLDIYRNHVVKVYPMSIPTFYRYMGYAISVDGFLGNGSCRIAKTRTQQGAAQSNQLSLF